MGYRYLIVGNSAGAVGAVEAIREVDTEGSMGIVSDETGEAYSRPMLGAYLQGSVSSEGILYRPPSFYQKSGASRIFGRRAEAIDPSRREVVLDGGERISYEKLLIATGGRPFVPKIEGLNMKGIFTFSSLEDVGGIRNWIRDCQPKSAIVLGGGFRGIQVAEALSSLEVVVTIVELADRLFQEALDPVASSIVLQAIRAKGVGVVTSHTIEKVLGGEVVKEVRLDDARHLPCDLLVLAVGVTPNVELARSGGLKVCRGIVVNSRMETSVPGTYACGDCAEVLDYSLGSSRLVPTWPAAYAGGRVAGFNMAGRVREWEGTTSMNSMHAFGRSVMTLGRTNPKEDERCDILWKLDESRSTYRKVVLYRGRVVGAILVDEVDGAGVILSLMRKRVEVTSFREELLKEDFGLACVPRATREGALEVYFNGAVE